MTFRSMDLRKLDSLTKYPSIPTYHEIDSKSGRLSEPALDFEGTVSGTEKIDGTNTRILLGPGDEYIIGSREEFLHASGDLIPNKSLGIVEAAKPIAESIRRIAYKKFAQDDGLLVLFGEVYGTSIGAAHKNYAAKGESKTGFRLFDIASFENVTEYLSWPIETFSGWRDHGGQTFLSQVQPADFADACKVELVPLLFKIDAGSMPKTVEDTKCFMDTHARETEVNLSGVSGGKAEGIVVRTNDRRVIAKMRFEDYERTARVSRR